jgi:mannose-6-phosphate isomerase-like protein (cupin superfamily)
MLVVHKKDLTAVASNHDTIDNVAVYRLFTAKSLPKIEEGKMPYINWAIIPPGKSFSLHHHGDQQVPVDMTIGMTEFFVIVSGTGFFRGGSEVERVTDGDMICIPRGEIHSLKNKSYIEPLIYICFGISTGGGTFIV